MKYMGSKRTMLRNGLGNVILEHGQSANRIVDLFCGSGSISWFAAEEISRPVLAVDLQGFAVVLAGAVIERTNLLDAEVVARSWLEQARFSHNVATQQIISNFLSIADNEDINEKVRGARLLCQEMLDAGPICRAYGGYYYSPSQALAFDSLIDCLPSEEPDRSVCLAATISAASKCAAAPGHTAQPFQPTTTAGRYIREAWSKDPFSFCGTALAEICSRRARVAGKAIVADALEVAAKLLPDDLVIVDPPYSSVQYSRFYHVLETIARGTCGPVSGQGRYPAVSERPQSAWSNKGTSKGALKMLLEKLAATGCTVVFTFPSSEASNGLSGDVVVEVANTWYSIERKLVNGRFSTLGGNNNHRASRHKSAELILIMKPFAFAPRSVVSIP